MYFLFACPVGRMCTQVSTSWKGVATMPTKLWEKMGNWTQFRVPVLDRTWVFVVDLTKFIGFPFSAKEKSRC